ncbi:MAG: trehalose-phosphatase [Myxococcota bacterium]|nr:trehalose-phosphatase [Myxococcota bacterium]
MHGLDLAFALPDPSRWRELVTHDRLALLLDFDGTLVEFAATPADTVLDDVVVETIERLVASGVHVSVVSGRPRAAIEPLIPRLPGIWWFAEHGAWHCADGTWTGPSAHPPELDLLSASLEALAQVPGARTERKTLSVCLHWREVPVELRSALLAAAELACDEWLQANAEYERLPGVDMLEVRRRSVHKGLAVVRVREHLDGARMIAIGDDVTDEDMFGMLVEGDVGIAVGEHGRRSQAHAALGDPAAVAGFLQWIERCRDGASVEAPPVTPILEMRPTRERSLVVLSNRIPTQTLGRQREVGGLVSALEPALRDRRGIWLGWSGHERDGKSALAIDAFAEPPRASFDLTPAWRQRFYGGFCNRVLWPLFHSFPRVTYHDADWEAYVAANDEYAQHALELARPDATIWVHDYHLLLVARALRRRGHQGPIGLFLHIPFPSRDLFESMPWASELLDAMLDFDLVGFHTARWAEHFTDAVRDLPGAQVDRGEVRRDHRITAYGVFPIPIDASVFTAEAAAAPDLAGFEVGLGERRLILGVDRLDYSKGIPERLAGYERLLERFPEWRGRVTFVQVSVPSRSEIPEYAELKHRVETMVGRINGAFGEADWIPVRYLYRSYDHAALAQLYRMTDVALVTPLRDGMNLVAKEFVAAQRPAAPGVLVLSRFAGAAAELTDAVLTNPYHPDGLAADLDRALRMPLEERQHRHRRMHAIVGPATPAAWSASFLDALGRAAERRLHVDAIQLRSAPIGDSAPLS